MSQYIALYRRFRPITFMDVVDQEQIVKVLKHQIINNQIGHAYLFCGSRGTGKTTTAKIFSRAVNCINPINGEPCNECEICKGILNSSITDVMEIDAASNNGVEDIRAIRENVIYAPTLAKYKVYIIDEVHMLSQSAFNALLKTLEEPPENVIFILATTEPHKIPITILSRCQRFEFRRISKEGIAKRLKMVCDENNIKCEENALLVIAQAAEGALRDGLSLLDQVISSGVTEITEENVREILGIAKVTETTGILEAILQKDINKMLNIVSTVINSGKDIKYFVWEIITLTRDVLIYKTTNDTSLINNFAVVEDIKKIADSTDSEKLSEIIMYLSEVEGNIKGATFPSILLEASLIELIKGKKQVVVKDVIPQIVEKPKTQETPQQQAVVVAQKIEEEKKESAVAPRIQNSTGGWRDIINNLKSSGKMSLYATLVSAKASIEADVVTIYFNQAFGKNVVEKVENMAALKSSILAILGHDAMVKCVLEGQNKKDETSSSENSLLNSGIDVNIL